jgi:hypothetical protein
MYTCVILTIVTLPLHLLSFIVEADHRTTVQERLHR